MTALLFAQRYWKLASLIVLALALAVQTVRLGHRSNQLEREKINSNELRAELKRISSKKNEQQVITVEKIKQVETIRREADKVAEKIEQAPLPGNCTTPRAVLEADL